MVGNVASKSWVQAFSTFGHFARSRRAINVAKGVLAYISGFVLVFSRSFDTLNKFPATFTSMTILLLVGGAGKSIGACVQATGLALIGICLGSVCFVILAELHNSQVAQGFVFAAIVYIFALVKAQGLKWFTFALLAILMAFNGIYTSVLVGSFQSAYLKEYIKAYCWSAAIVLTVNITVFPITSEKELRRTLILSLEHVATFTHLLAKGYTLELSEEERATRDHLAQTIRADFGFLVQKIEETSIEVNFSRFSMADYQCFVTRTRGMQLALITAYSSLVNVEKKDTELFKTRFLPSTMKSFTRFRSALNLTMREISLSLGCKPLEIPTTYAGYAEYMDLERQDSSTSLSLARPFTRSTLGDDSIDERLNTVSRRLAEEVGDEEDAFSPTTTFDESNVTKSRHSRAVSVAAKTSRRDSFAAEDNNTNRGDDPSAQEATGDNPTTRPTSQPITPKSPHTQSARKSPGFCIRSLRHVYDRFASDQHNILVECLMEGNLHGGNDDSLRLHDPLPSLQDIYRYRYVPATDNPPNPRFRRRRRRTWMDSVPPSPTSTPTTAKSEKRERSDDVFYEMWREKTTAEQKFDETAAASHHSLTRVYSFLFAMEQFVTELEVLYHKSKREHERRLHVHFFEHLHRPHKKKPVESRTNEALASPDNEAEDSPSPGDDPNKDSFRELKLAEALALLEGTPYTKIQTNIWQKLAEIEQLLRSPTSVYAFKTAAAATIFSVLILHPVPRPWFINFGLTSGALTIVTALTPTLGQSILAFLFQIAGSGFGYVWALILLEIFHNVGGYHFNPFGIICLLIPYAFVLMYVLYEMPQFFIAALLALNGTGTVLVLEWINVEYLLNTHYDAPTLRFGKAFATLGVALGISGVFQLFILRNPARRTLRKRIGAMLYSQLGYLTLLQAYVRGVMPTDPSKRAPSHALKRVEEELRHRELRIQGELITLRPLVSFAAAEPQFSRPFRADIINKLLRTSQIILDRMRESRVALASQPLPDIVLTNFVRELWPYRRRNTQVLQLSFYLVASSILSKSPLLRETPAELESGGQHANFMHDVLVLASRLAKTSEGASAIRSGDFTRYFHYIVGITSVNEHLKNLEEYCRDLFGELEGHLA